MSTLNFDLGYLSLGDEKLEIDNRNSYNKTVTILEPILIICGIWLLCIWLPEWNFNYLEILEGAININQKLKSTLIYAQEFLAMFFCKLFGLVLMGTAVLIASSPHLELLVANRIQREVMITESSWYGLNSHQSCYSFDQIISLVVKGQYSESVILYTLWLNLGENKKICLGNTFDERVEDAIKAICTALEFNENHVNRLGIWKT